MLYSLDLLFNALADPTRRVLLRRLSQGPAVVGQLRSLCPTISLAAVSKHLQVLRRAGLVAAQRQGKFYRFVLLPEALRHADQWLAHYRQESAEASATIGNIALLGLSANPPHVGHLLISQTLLDYGYKTVWWSIAPEQEFKPKATLAPYAHRVKLAELLLAGEPSIQLDATEAQMTIRDEHHRTAEWLAEMARRHPQANFTFVMGADSWAHPTKGFHTWGGFGECLDYAGVLVIPRPDHMSGLKTAAAAQALQKRFHKKPGIVPRGRWALYPDTLLEISSTSVRTQLAKGETPQGVTPEQLDYIRRNGLYIRHVNQ
jgi:nicotinate (nicotinamide) nucleotide adenylyltransferase